MPKIAHEAIIAHQMKSSVSAALQVLQTLKEGYAGPLSIQQIGLVNRACSRLDDALRTVKRLLEVKRIMDGEEKVEGLTDLVALVSRHETRYRSLAATAGQKLWIVSSKTDLFVAVRQSLVLEAINALVENAVKYTPAHGHIRLGVSLEARNRIMVEVADSGPGVPEAERERIFEPFVRSDAKRTGTTPGTGLGLAFVKTLLNRAGGEIQVDNSEWGGARFVMTLPAATVDSESLHEGEGDMADAYKIVVIGGVAAGPKVASKVVRMMPDAHVTIIEKGKALSYAGCGLPYYISGVVKEQKELMCTPVGTVRDPVFFQNVKHVQALSGVKATEIDRKGKRVGINRECKDETTEWIEYDKLVLATGARPVMPPLPGRDLQGVYSLHGVEDAEGIRAKLAGGQALDVVIVGGGLIGVEVTEALVERGCRVTIVEMMDQVLTMLDRHMARLVEQHMESKGVRIMTGTRLTAIKESGNNAGSVGGVVTDRGDLAADMVIMAVGVRPNVDLAREAGLEIGEKTGAIVVDEHMRTADPDIFAAGDCVEVKNLVSGRAGFVPLGSTANKQGRVAANNICGQEDSFPGVLGSSVCKVFDFCVARTGLSEKEARDLGYDVEICLAPGPDKAHFMPAAKPCLLKLVMDRKTRKLLGAQAVGPGAGDKRIDVAAMALTAGLTVDQLAKVDLCYAPPYSPAMDNIITAANVACNKLDGHMQGITPEEVHAMQERGEDFFFLDARSPGEYEVVRLPGSTLIPLGALRGRLDEVPRDKPIVAFCKISLRGYEAALILKAAGYNNVRVMDGGVLMWPYEKEN